MKNYLENNVKSVANDIARELKNTFDYYDYVYFDFIVEAVENTLHDYEMEIPPLKEIHKHIKENYI